MSQPDPGGRFGAVGGMGSGVGEAAAHRDAGEGHSGVGGQPEDSLPVIGAGFDLHPMAVHASGPWLDPVVAVLSGQGEHRGQVRLGAGERHEGVFHKCAGASTICSRPPRSAEA